MTSKLRFFLLFFLFTLVYLVATLFGSGELTTLLKPLLLIPLMASTVFTEVPSHKNLLFTALGFCWAGDVLLLFQEQASLYFILGLSAFLIGHIFYIILFVRLLRNKGKISFKLKTFIAILIYLLVFITWIFDYLGEMAIPVIIYAGIISAMLYFAVELAPHLTKVNGALLFIGALSFVISDSILAVNKFYASIPLSGFFIMITYLLAQGAIVWAMLSRTKQ